MAMEPTMMRSNNIGDRTIIAIRKMISSKHLLKNFAYPPLTIPMTFSCSTQSSYYHWANTVPPKYIHSYIQRLTIFTKITPLIYAFIFPLPLPSLVTNLFCRQTGYICIGFQMGWPSALYLASVSKISVGHDLPCSPT